MELERPFAPPVGKAALLIGQSGRRAHLDYMLGTESAPAGGSVYAELYTGRFLSFEQAAFVDYWKRYFPGSLVEVGLSWKDNRVNAGYCDMSEPACVAGGGATDPELDIVAGKYDAALGVFTKTMQAHPNLKFSVRVDYEVSPNLHCAPTDKDRCPAYTDAFRYLRKLWDDVGVSNVALVFHPTRGWAKMMYPGDDVTDWIAFSVFNHDVCLPTPEGDNGGCRLFDIARQRPQLRGLTYINMKWAGGWVYGEDWTQGAFGNVDARLTRHPETQAYFCDELATGRYVSEQGSELGCARGAVPELPLPPNADARAYERMVVLGSNRCATTTGGRIVQQDCAGLEVTGEARFRVEESAGRARLWSDLSWLCWSVDGDEIAEEPCRAVEAQRFQVQSKARAKITGTSR